MRIGVLGTGMVGEAIATRLIELQHEVMLGSRTADNPKALEWAAHHAPNASVGTFAQAAAFGTFVFHCANGGHAEKVIASASEPLAGKVVIDTSNPIERSADGVVQLFTDQSASLAERLQAAAPKARFVKALNTITASVMVHPEQIAGDHLTFLAGDDPGAKTDTRALLEQFGWSPAQIVDLGDLTAARSAEAYLLLWLKLWGHVGHPLFNLSITPAAGAEAHASPV
ncbi:MAG: NAD(P)-binding domain-containing protein [Solirubrobacteraceae bacterium]|nr:NAD(P)-binding domain-containing protein [Solirubrobacteraceae bacterium]